MESLLPPAEEIITPDLLERQARMFGDKVFVVYEDGEEWTYTRTATEAWQVANALRALGVGEGDHVSVWVPGGRDGVRLLFGILAAGAIFSPLNVAYRGGLLEHALGVTGSSLLIGHADLLPRLQGLEVPALKTIVAVGPESERVGTINGVGVDGTNDLRGGPDRPLLAQPRQPWDPMCLMFTSGTTGPSKGVLQSYRFYDVFCEGAVPVTSEGRFYGNAPVCHNGWPLILNGALRKGASVFITDGFNARTFWDHARRFNVTAAYLVGSMATMLLKQPAKADDRDHPLEFLCLSPNVKDAVEFTDRFGLLPSSGYGSTEVGVALLTDPGEPDTTTCGRARPGYEVRVVDEHDIEVRRGTAGQLVMRHDQPWVLNSGYKGMPEANAELWRNGWLHTGDVMRQDEDGKLYFIDRLKDVIRRRGENISSAEIEFEVMKHSGIAQVAAFGVRDAEGDEEVMIAVRPNPSAEPLNVAELTTFLIERLPHYMVPRYIDVVTELPLTATERVQKSALRAQGVTKTTWDREAAGIILKRQKLSAT